MSLMTGFRKLFESETAKFQEGLQVAVSAYLETIRENFDLVRKESVVRQGEEDPEFRDRVSEASEAIRECVRRFQPLISV